MSLPNVLTAKSVGGGLLPAPVLQPCQQPLVGAGMREALAGAIGGAISLAVTYPLYTVVVRLQTDRRGPRRAAAREKPGSDVRHAVAQVYDSGGVAAFFRGANSALVAVFIQSGVYYWAYERFAAWHGHSARPLAHMLYGWEAAVATTLLTNPLWVVNGRQMTETRAAKTRELAWWQALAVILFEEGLPGLWSGVGPALVLTVNPAIQFFTAQWLTGSLRRVRPGGAQRSVTAEAFVVGGGSKLVSTVATYPLATVRMLLQSSEDGDTGRFRYSGPLQAILALWSSEGPLGFFRGLDLKLLQTVLTAALLFSVRDNVRLLVDRYAGRERNGRRSQ